MKKIMLNGKVLDVLDETPGYYVCPPDNRNESYHFVSKLRAVELSQAQIESLKKDCVIPKN